MALSIIASPGQCHSCCPKQDFLKVLPSQKLLIVEVKGQHPAPTRAPINLTSVRQSCFTSKAKALNSRPVPVSGFLLSKSPYLYWLFSREFPGRFIKPR